MTTTSTAQTQPGMPAVKLPPTLRLSPEQVDRLSVYLTAVQHLERALVDGLLPLDEYLVQVERLRLEALGAR